jgi:hypothetical protein
MYVYKEDMEGSHHIINNQENVNSSIMKIDNIRDMPLTLPRFDEIKQAP